jgi:hypothetical protein
MPGPPETALARSDVADAAGMLRQLPDDDGGVHRHVRDGGIGIARSG